MQVRECKNRALPLILNTITSHPESSIRYPAVMSTNPSGRTVWINGKYVPEHEAGVSIFDSALMYGDMIFEMARSFNRIPFRLREHLDRLYRSAKLFRIPEPRNILVGVSRNYTIELAKKLGILVREKNFGVYEVIQADEAFYTSTPFSVLPCTKIDGIDIGTGLCGPVTQRVIDAWSESVGVDIVAQAKRFADRNAAVAQSGPTPYRMGNRK